MTELLDNLIDLYTRRAAKLRQVRDILGDDRELTVELCRALNNEIGLFRTGEARGEPETSGTHFERVCDYWRKMNNMWLTGPDVARALGITRGGVAHLLYKTHAQHFEKKPHPTHKKMQVWRLTESTLKAASDTTNQRKEG